MELKPIKSSNLDLVGYDPETAELQIEFKGGGLYAYDAVPEEIHTALWAAKRAGAYFHKEIRDKYKTRRLK